MIRGSSPRPAFFTLTRMANTGLFKAELILFVWALPHHLLAGERHLLMDIGVGGVAMALLTAGVVV